MHLSARDRSVSLPGRKQRPQGCRGPEKTSMGVPHILTSKTRQHEKCYRQSKNLFTRASMDSIQIFFKPHPCGFTIKKHHLLFFGDIIWAHTFFFFASFTCGLWPTPSRAVRFPAPHIKMGEKEGIWPGRPGSPPQNSMPTPLVYNGPVRITAGAWRAEKGNTVLTCLFVLQALSLCSVCKVPVGFVWFNSQSIQAMYSVSTIAATLWALGWKSYVRINRL